MRIGILTFYKVANFGANLQALSTFYYLKSKGYDVVFLNYMANETEDKLLTDYKLNIQTKCHIDFIDKFIPCQTRILHDGNEVFEEIKNRQIDSIIIGSDAVVQHHPFISRLVFGPRRLHLMDKVAKERLFPNPFWGVPFSAKIPTVMMSVSSQNSEFKYFDFLLKSKMKKALDEIKYLSVRDEWTKRMFESIKCKSSIHVTPDPVFAFNMNVPKELIPTREELDSKFNLPQKYVLVSLHSQSLSVGFLQELGDAFKRKGLECVAFPMPSGVKFQHLFKYQIQTPLSPLDWYSLIKNASAYIGSNMHPIIVSLHNAVPCFSIDHWGTMDFWGNKKDNGSSKIEHILSVYNLKNNRKTIQKGICSVSVQEIIDAIDSYPKLDVSKQSQIQLMEYNNMMTNIIKEFKNENSNCFRYNF